MTEERKGAAKTTSPEVRAAGAAIAAACAAMGAVFGAAVGIHGSTDAIPSRPPPAASAPAHAAGGASELSTQLVRGRSLYAQECVSCHGSRAQGGIGPDLRRLEISDAQIAMTIQAGVKPAMPAYGSKYGDANIQAITQYVRSQKR